METVRLKPGRYRHFKGNLYEVIGVGKHSETEEDFVIYKALYGEQGIWLRPLEMFLDKVKAEGKEVSRFEYIGD